MERAADYDKVTLTLPKPTPEYLETKSCDKPVDLSKHYLTSDINNIIRCEIVNSRILSEGSDVKKVYEITLQLPPNNNHEFFPGDTIGICPRNLKADVDGIISRLEIDDSNANVRVKIKEDTLKKKAKIPIHIPENFNAKKLFEECLDIRSLPKKLFIRALVDYTADPKEKRFLEILCSTEGASLYAQYVVERGVKFIDLLNSLKSCKPPLSLLLEHLPRLQARPYSLANYPKSSNQIKIVFSSINENNICIGLTTHMLENILSKVETNNYVDICLRNRTTFCYNTDDLTKNIIMIGPGTAISPFISFLEFRQQNSKLFEMGKAMLITGCRFKEKNALYRKELIEYQSDYELTRLYECFSRDPESKFKYVQDQIDANRQEILELLQDDNTKCYICGNDKIIKNIEQEFIRCLEQNVVCKTEEESSPDNNCSKSAQDTLKHWKTTSKLILDLWF